MSKLASPELNWKDGKTPVSGRFDDVYFSVDDGMAETDYVFVKGCGLPEGFEGKDHFVVAETGFGTGLNFLSTLKAWRESGTDCQLHFYSVEAYPLTKGQLKQAYQNFKGLEDEAEQLISVYPQITPGFHHVLLEGGKVKLTLMFGEAAEMFSQMNGKVDAWYLDGFAPAKNPEMWRAEVFEQMGRLSDKGTVLSTFTAAGFVKRGLIEVGFEMWKRPGYGRKRESLQGSFQGDYTRSKLAWYERSYKPSGKKKIAVIGAGAAGCIAAQRLVADGHEVIVFERNSHAGSEGSGNKIGLLNPKLFLSQEGADRFNTVAYLHAVRFYEQFVQTPWHGKRGLFQMAKDDGQDEKFRKLVELEVLPSNEISYLEADEASERLKMKVERGGIWFENSGCIEPSKLCQIVADTLNVRYDCAITKMEQSDDGWTLYSDEEIVFEGDCVIITTAGENQALNTYSELPMQPRRGQVSYVKATEETEKLEHALSYGGYMLPAKDGVHVVGASFDYWTDFFDHSYKDVKEESHDFNLQTLSIIRNIDEVEIVGGRANVRAMTADHYPMVGPVFSQDWYIQEYQGMSHGPKYKQFAPAEYIDGLYTICGLGARGVQTAPLLADILSSYISGTPCPVENAVRESLHPARFLMRKIIKGKL
ncbi:bifunctional tRNA (5-methylaminomethyl-2-thiouridine)(34)-methyltransferase MnmD/FAD-dependent 5-carboxymethylaminomethyl-2-thiouridine(34) oxidoreductase MnmC [Terasakiella sp. A23]|uniref:bifunctional tRNA (5-methylaminomethyl-2-thiouridine)(34)-methyltransferase MnmD/FAD-dependent 5-carboxymethylaminomethyl-2-thiouridine(34) oxidoreductase MnmC n=1 Tax=Terasakiella sp. FCG-A23 TaxID=3080561 RepID=UPI002952ED52|nr:bifunctional tRNA (5-methylaminomethyl-2-thiouridine)(34)-methyltransferase MnmD/FAD-dependent 5-carboxymethylaminomethyl-2-thiouridine(34) oxidoreductase MnmC [Terasakiella sp. A23]MDV7338716.1 bifunctional tRNA (5-methylaminomethyl-2-thiouridine)(34)-methyltransferase MnmD/FAD-dependent 5-carboxymethylaminomethyl-2-thiouridine(34) oxidoreductase MnmC [Terasakiella sp. A23]